MSIDSRYLNLKGAAAYIGQSTRWMRRHYVQMIIDGGLEVFRVPKNSKNGRLMFLKESLDKYIKGCSMAVASSRRAVCDACGQRLDFKNRIIDEQFVVGQDGVIRMVDRWICKPCKERKSEMYEEIFGRSCADGKIK